jgi:hypothetical protein
LFLNHTCYNDTSWTQPVQQVTAVSAIQRFADVAYDAGNFSILSVDFNSHRQKVTYPPDDFRLLFDTLFVDNSTATPVPSDDAIMVDAMVHDVGWGLRLYHDLFSSDTKTPVDLLQNMLIIPIHFSTGAWEYVNSTYATDPTIAKQALFALPDNLNRTVSGARRSPRVMAVPWSVYVFVAVTGVLFVYGFAILLWIMLQKQAFPNSSGFAELVFSARSQMSTQGDSISAATESAAQYLWRHGLSNAGSQAAAKACVGMKIRAVVMRDAEGRKRVCIVVLPSTETERKTGELLESRQEYL